MSILMRDTESQIKGLIFCIPLLAVQAYNLSACEYVCVRACVRVGLSFTLTALSLWSVVIDRTPYPWGVDVGVLLWTCIHGC